MKPSMTLWRRASLAGLALLAACGKHGPAAPAAATASATTRAAPPASTRLPPSAAGKPAPLPAHAGSATPAMAASAPASAATAVAPLAVAGLTLGDKLDAKHQVVQSRDSFATDDSHLYAVVDTTGKSDGATLAARWSYLEGKGQLVSNVSQSIATEGPAITSFEVHNPDLWPAGKYRVEISLDGKPVAKKDFTITGH